MNAIDTIRALDSMAARLSTARCIEPQLVEHVRAGLEEQRRSSELAALPRIQQASVLGAIRRVERVLLGHVSEVRP
jgi:hypothetical protein